MEINDCRCDLHGRQAICRWALVALLLVLLIFYSCCSTHNVHTVRFILFGSYRSIRTDRRSDSPIHSPQYDARLSAFQRHHHQTHNSLWLPHQACQCYCLNMFILFMAKFQKFRTCFKRRNSSTPNACDKSAEPHKPSGTSEHRSHSRTWHMQISEFRIRSIAVYDVYVLSSIRKQWFDKNDSANVMIWWIIGSRVFGLG